MKSNAFLSKYRRTQLLLSIYNHTVSILKHITENNSRKKIIFVYSFVMIKESEERKGREGGEGGIIGP